MRHPHTKLTALLLASCLVPLGVPRAQTATPQPAVSGLLFGSFNYSVPTTAAPLAGQVNNAFSLDRAYLTVRAPVGDRMSIRLTTDVYQSTEATANAFTIRAKYAFLQYDAPPSASGAQLMGRVGILQTVVIEHIETFWPRYLSQTAVERAGYFSSADVGIAGQYTLPANLGEVYGIIVNGPGYTSRERDRFKDFGLRVSLTPLAGSTAMPLLRTFTLTAWGYKGATASSLVTAGVGDALDRSRGGLFAGIKDHRLVLGAEVSRRTDGGDAGVTPATRTVSSSTGRLLSALAVVRPLAFGAPERRSPFGVVARYDHVSPTVRTRGITPAPALGDSWHTFIGGLFYDLDRAQFALDYQESLGGSTGMANAPFPRSKAYFAHFKVDF